MSDENETTVPVASKDAKDGARVPAGKRRALWAGIAVAVLVLLVAVPAFIASQPGFMARYGYLKVEYSTWMQSKGHADVACQKCHVDPGFSEQAGYTLSMAGEFYLSLFDPNHKLPAFKKPTIAACVSCHDKLITTSPKGDLKIPHRAHVDVLKVECATCHQYLVHQLSPEGRHTPTMAACLKCHNGQTAKSSCSTCHTNKAAPDNHKEPDWLVVHADRQKEIDCVKCHKWKADWCADCHSQRPASHVATWRTTHGAAVKLHRDCEACHTGPFCVRCHGVVPQLNFNPTLQLVK